MIHGLQYLNSDMDPINGQTVLEEDYDENYEPTEEGAYYDVLTQSVR